MNAAGRCLAHALRRREGLGDGARVDITADGPRRRQPSKTMAGTMQIAWLPTVTVSLCLGCAPAPAARENNDAHAPPPSTSDAADARRELAATEPDATTTAQRRELAAAVDDDPMANHKSSQAELLGLFAVQPLSPEASRRVQPDAFLQRVFGVDGPSRMNQGNKAIARHTIGKQTCLDNLARHGVVVQTAEQRAICKGHENMLPVWQAGKDPWFCIDAFEFPNQACELPMVWTPPTQARKVCELQGKRLCSDIEWNMACRGDPAGGPDRTYAYGDRLDLEVCNTHTPHRRRCDPSSAKTAWSTCTTDTEPSGSFPQCRSRFGVFDQHGNVAEVMARRESGVVYTQLKGSAWFYQELAREPGKPVPAGTRDKAGAYPDHCNFNPRWHVEKLSSAWHVNYHLGFRCCMSIP